MRAQEFDLRPAVNRFRQKKRFVKVGGVGIAVAFVLASLYRLALQPNTEVTLALVTVAFAGAIGSLVVVFGTEARFPDTLMITDEGFEFVFSSGAPRVFKWADPNLRLEFIDSRFRQGAIEHPERFACLLSVSLHPVWLPTCPLTEEAYLGLLEVGAARGLNVDPDDWSGTAFGDRRVIMKASG
jgi:hypothetical protein